MFAARDILAIKLVTGEELIARYVSSISQHEITVDHPVVMGQRSDGKMGMAPALFSANLEKPVQIQMTSIVLIAPARTEVADAYATATSSIVVPTSKILLG